MNISVSDGPAAICASTQHLGAPGVLVQQAPPLAAILSALANLVTKQEVITLPRQKKKFPSALLALSSEALSCLAQFAEALMLK